MEMDYENLEVNQLANLDFITNWYPDYAPGDKNTVDYPYIGFYNYGEENPERRGQHWVAGKNWNEHPLCQIRMPRVSCDVGGVPTTSQENPTSNTKLTKCVIMINDNLNFGKWQAIDCLLPQYTLCERRTSYACPKNQNCLFDNYDEINWVEYNGPEISPTIKLEFALLTDIRRNWNQAKALCADMSASLASIANQDEQNFIESDYFWNNLQNINQNSWPKKSANQKYKGFWLGGKEFDQINGNFKWLLDEYLVRKRNIEFNGSWYDGNPDGNNDDCLFMINDNHSFGRWEDGQCLLPQYVLCQRRKIEICPATMILFSPDNSHPYCAPRNIKSPNYPNDYDNDQLKIYNISVPSLSSGNYTGIGLKIVDFDLEPRSDSTSECTHDHLKFSISETIGNITNEDVTVDISGNFPTWNSNIFETSRKFCGDETDLKGLIWDLVFEIDGVSSLDIEFKTNDEHTHRGFLIEYWYLESFCDAGKCIQNNDACLYNADTLQPQENGQCINGRCVDEVVSFTCDCDVGWEGEFCDIPSPEGIKSCYDDSGYDNIINLRTQGWRLYDGPLNGNTGKLLYRFFPKQLLSYNGAIKFCQNQGGVLAAITNQDEYDFVISEKVFSDMIYRYTDTFMGTFVGAYHNGSHFLWLENENLELNQVANLDFLVAEWLSGYAPWEKDLANYPYLTFFHMGYRWKEYRGKFWVSNKNWEQGLLCQIRMPRISCDAGGVPIDESD